MDKKEIKQYALKRLNKIKIQTPNNYSELYWREINTPKDVENQMIYADRVISGYKAKGYLYLDDVEDCNLELYKCWKAIEKAINCINLVSVIVSPFDNLSKEVVDKWFETLECLKILHGEMLSNFLSRPEGI